MANIVTAKIYGPAQKMRFLPYAFAEFYLQAENYVCSFMKKYAVGYDGGCWEYITYENGACAFIAPDGYQLTLPNYFDEPVSAKEAGIIVALYAYSHFCYVAFERGWQRVNETMAERYQRCGTLPNAPARVTEPYFSGNRLTRSAGICPPYSFRKKC